MKKTIKTFIGTFLLAILLGSGIDVIKNSAYTNKIPRKFLIDGEYIDSQDDFKYYKIENTDKEVAVACSDASNKKQFNIPSTVKIDNVEYEVTAIWREGFSFLDDISITFPSTLKTIDYEAFFNTTFSSNNTQLTIPYTVSGLGTAAFFRTNITDLVFSDGESSNIGVCTTAENQTNGSSSSEATKSALETIGDFAFAKCKSLKNITFSNSLKRIQEEAFEYCENLTNVAFLSGLEHIGSRAFNCCYNLAQVYLPNNLFTKSSDTDSTIGEFAFSFCKNEMKIQASVPSLPGTFDKQNPNWNRKKEFAPDSYEVNPVEGDMYISSSWLYQDTGSAVRIQSYLGDAMENIAFPEIVNGHPVTEIDTDCFKNLTGKEKVKRFFLPKTLVSIPDSLFPNEFRSLTYIGTLQGNNCYSVPTEDNLFDLSKLSDLKTIGVDSFRGDRDKIYTIKLPGNLTEIKKQAFADLKNVKSLSFETRTSTESLSIGEKAFFQLGTNITNGTVKLDFPKELTNISNNAFAGSNCLSELTFEENTSKELRISSQVFAGCKNLSKVIIGRRNEITIGERAFAAAMDSKEAPEDYSFHPYLQFIYLPSNNLTITNDCFDRQLRTAVYFSGNKPDGFSPNSCFTETTNDSSTLDFYHSSSSTLFNFNVTPTIFTNAKLASQQGTQTYSIYDQGLNDGSSSNNCTYLLYEEGGKKKAILTKYRFNMNDRTDGTQLNVTVPETVSVNGSSYTVTEIADGAFGNCDGYSNSKVRTISSVKLPDTIEKIGNYAFFRLVGLESINMPSSLKSIGELAFAFTGIQKIEHLNSDVDFLDSTGKSVFGNRAKSSPFLNCPNLESVSLLGVKDSSKIKVSDGRCLVDSSGYILTVFPKYAETNKTFEDSKFYYGAYKTVGWIENLTISQSDFPTSGTSTISQSLFVGFVSQKDIRKNLTFKGRITSITGTDDDHNFPIKILTLKVVNRVLAIPPDSFANTKIEVIRIPYSEGGTIPSNLLKGVSTDNVIFQVQQGENGQYNNGGDNYSTEGEKGLLDFGTNSGYKTIGNNAFEGISGITKLNIPTIETVGEYAFHNCKLESITFGEKTQSIGTMAFSPENYNYPPELSINTTINGNTLKNYIDATTVKTSAFYKTKISELTIGKDVTNIMERGFRSSSLSALNFEESDKELQIGLMTFNQCNNLSEIDFSTRPIKISSTSFQNCTNLSKITFGSKTATIGYGSFDGCTNLSSVTFGSGIQSISQTAFQKTALTDANLSACTSLKEINGFESCKQLTTVTLPASLENIGENTFNGCTALSSITLPDSLKSIGKSAFQGCTALASITIPGSVTAIGDSAFQDCTALTSIEIPSSVTSISNNLFNGCNKLISVTLPNTIESIGDSAFQGCTALASITIPDSVSSIGNSAFQSSGIKEITLPENLSSLGSSCFESCSSLEKVLCKGKNFTLQSNTFSNCDNLKTIILLGSDNNGYSDSCFNNLKNLNLVVLPNDFDYTMNTSIFNNCPSLATGAVCIGNYDTSKAIGTWSRLKGSTTQVRYAYKEEGSTAKGDKMYFWKWDKENESVTLTQYHSTSNTSNQTNFIITSKSKEDK